VRISWQIITTKMNKIKKIAIIGTIIGLCFVGGNALAAVLFPVGGGTGTSTAPGVGYVLVGQPGGVYAPQATSTLGFGASSQWTTTSTGIFYSSGNVGIGTDSPSAKLDVNGAIYATGGAISTNYNLYAGGSGDIVGGLYTSALYPRVAAGSLLFKNYGGDTKMTMLDGGHFALLDGSYLILDGNTTGAGTKIYEASGLNLDSGDAGRPINLKIAGVDKLVVATTGNVGIGTTTPSGVLTVASSTGGNAMFTVLPNGNVGVGTNLPTQKFHVIGAAYADSNMQSPTMYFNILRPLTTGGDLRFLNSTGTEVMRMTAGGNLGIGTSTPSQMLTVNGDILMSSSSGTTNGSLRWAGGSKLYEQTDVTNGRMIYQPNGDRFEVLNEAGGTFLFAVHGANSQTPSRIVNYQGTTIGGGTGWGATPTPPTNGLMVQGNVIIGATSTPATALVVNGTSTLSQGIIFGDGTSQVTAAVTPATNIKSKQWLGYYGTSTTIWDDPFSAMYTTSTIEKVIIGVKNGSVTGNIYYSTSQTSATSSAFKLFSTDQTWNSTTTGHCYTTGATSTACSGSINASSTPGIHNWLRFVAYNASTTALTSEIFYKEN